MICIPHTCNDLHLIIFPGSVAEEGLLIDYHSKEQGYARGNLPLPLRFPDRLAATNIAMWAGATSSTRNFPCLPASKQFAKHNPKRFHV
jgi:hypothetical protein